SIPERLRQMLCFTKLGADPTKLAEADQAGTNLEPHIERLLERYSARRQGAGGVGRPGHEGCLPPLRRPREGFRTCQSEVDDGLLPGFGANRMVGERLRMLESFGVECLNRRNDFCVERAPMLVKNAPVGDFVGKGVSEGVFELREETGLVEEIRSLEAHEAQRKG